jgi:membrane-associated protease RseP (regulator of RpoE activity)
LASNLREYGLPALLLGASLVTITASGACFMRNFRRGLQPVMRDSDMWPWPLLVRHPHLWFSGLAFSLALLGILLVHEFGHYIACRAHRIRATLPFVLPAPTLSGTVGAVIKIRSRIPDLDALMDVGIYGPLAGYVASALAIAVGFLLSRPAAAYAPEPIVRFGGEPVTIRLVHALLLHWKPGLQPFSRIVPHPILIAGWIGLFITSLNLIPAGQLDGGHILYALSPRLHRITTRVLPPLLLVAGVFYWAGWILWGVILLLPAMRHPNVPNFFALSRRRKALGVVGIAIFLLAFTPTPFYDNSLLQLLALDHPRASLR